MPDESRPYPDWMRFCLRAAAAYNVVWGLYAILWPTHYFTWAGLEAPRYPELWQCIGMIVGVYGIGYAIAARDPARHWPIVLVGLLGKIFGPLGFLYALLSGSLPWSFAWILVTNDLIWWIPFAMILWFAVGENMAPKAHGAEREVDRSTLLATVRSSAGKTLLEHSEEAPQLVVFLRHFGCLFCREAVTDLARNRTEIESDGTQILLVHMSAPDKAAAFLERHGLASSPHVSDPHARLYDAFQLERGRFTQLMGPRTWVRGVQALLSGHFVGSRDGDGFRMPGTFLLHRGAILREFRNRHAGERPAYCALTDAAD